MANRLIENRGYGYNFNTGAWTDRFGNTYTSKRSARNGFEKLAKDEKHNSQVESSFYQELGDITGMSPDELVSLISGKGLNGKDLLQFILNQQTDRESFDLTNGYARYAQLQEMGMSRQAALAALTGGQIGGAPLDTQNAQMAQQAALTSEQNAIGWSNARSSSLDAFTNAQNSYYQNYETRFLILGRQLLEPIAGEVYGWLLEHEGDPNYVVPDDAKRSPEKFKRWLLQKDADGNYIRPDGEALIKSEAWEKMSHSMAGIYAFRKEFADNIAGRAPHEMEWDAQNARTQRLAQTAILNCNKLVAQNEAFQSSMQQWIWEFNSGMSLSSTSDGAYSIAPASTDSPWYDTFYNADGTLREDLPILFAGLSADLQTRMQDCMEYDKINEEKWEALKSDIELRKNYSALYALIFGDMKDTFEQLKQQNPELAGQLFRIQILYQQLFGTVQNRDVFEGAFSAHTGRISANASAKNAETNEAALDETIEHDTMTEQVDIYNAETQRLSQGGTRIMGLTIPSSGFRSDGVTTTTPEMDFSNGKPTTNYNLSRLPKRGQ